MKKTTVFTLWLLLSFIAAAGVGPKLPIERESVDRPASDRKEHGNLIEVSEIVMFHSGMEIPSAILGVSQAPQITVFEQPFLLTSAGQNAELQIAGVLAKRAGLSAVLSKLAQTQELRGAKTLVLVLGASMKGLGAAGLDMAGEKARVAALVAAAQKTGVPILCLHLGGEARRGQQTDEFIAEFLPSANAVVVVKSGDGDGLFSRICQGKNIPLTKIEKIADAAGVLKTIFKH